MTCQIPITATIIPHGMDPHGSLLRKEQYYLFDEVNSVPYHEGSARKAQMVSNLLLIPNSGITPTPFHYFMDLIIGSASGPRFPDCYD